MLVPPSKYYPYFTMLHGRSPTPSLKILEKSIFKVYSYRKKFIHIEILGVAQFNSSYPSLIPSLNVFPTWSETVYLTNENFFHIL